MSANNQYKNSWKECEIEYLRKNWGKIYGRAMANNLNRTYCAIRHKANRLNLGINPYSNFLTNNPMKNNYFVENNRKYQILRWKDKNSPLNSPIYIEKQRLSIKKLWKNKLYMEKMKIRDLTRFPRSPFPK